MAINCPGYFTFFAGHHGVSSIYIQLQPVNMNSYACTPSRNCCRPHGDYSIKMLSFTAARDHHSHSGVRVMHPSAYILLHVHTPGGGTGLVVTIEVCSIWTRQALATTYPGTKYEIENVK